MSKIIVIPSNTSDIDTYVKMGIDGILLGVINYATEVPMYLDIDDIINIAKKYPSIEVIVSLNKIMHNNDLDKMKSILFKLNNIANIKVMFYDMAIYKIVKDNKLSITLILSQEHLNTSFYTSRFYEKLGICYAYISSDITKEELLAIKKNTCLKILFNVYGYLPISNSRRKLLTNYLDYVNLKKEDDIYYICLDNEMYPIKEDDNGTTIYTSKVVNLINRIDEIKEIDYFILNSFNIDSDKFINDLDMFIKRKKSNTEEYVGFFDTKTIYKVRKGD